MFNFEIMVKNLIGRGVVHEGFIYGEPAILAFDLLREFPITLDNAGGLMKFRQQAEILIEEVTWALSTPSSHTELLAQLAASGKKPMRDWSQVAPPAYLPIGDVVDMLIDTDIPEWLYGKGEPPQGFGVSKVADEEGRVAISTPTLLFTCDGGYLNEDYSLVDIFNSIPYVYKVQMEKSERKPHYYENAAAVASLAGIQAIDSSNSAMVSIDYYSTLNYFMLRLEKIDQFGHANASMQLNLPDAEGNPRSVLVSLGGLVRPADLDDRQLFAINSGEFDFTAPEVIQEYWDKKLQDVIPMNKLDLAISVSEIDASDGGMYDVGFFAMLHLLIANHCGMLPGTLNFTTNLIKAQVDRVNDLDFTQHALVKGVLAIKREALGASVSEVTPKHFRVGIGNSTASDVFA